MEAIEIQVEARPEAWGAPAQAQGVTLAARVKELIGVTARVRVRAPSFIERSMGKARRVIDKRAKG